MEPDGDKLNRQGKGRAKRRVGGLVLLGAAFFWCSLVGAMDAIMGGRLVRQVQAHTSYVPVDARVIDAKVVERDGDEGTVYEPIITYEFHVAGQRHESSLTRHGMCPAGYHTAHAMVRDHPPGTAVRAWHDPHEPSRAVLFREVSGADLAMVVFMIPFNVVGVGLAVAAWTMMRAKPARPAGGTLLSDDGELARLELVETRAMAALLGVPAIVCFLGSFVVGFGWRMSPPIEVPGAILAASVLIAMWCARANVVARKRGDLELVVDRRSRALVLPRHVAKQLSRESLPFAAIDRIEAVCEREGDSDSAPIHSVKLKPMGGNHTPVVTLKTTSDPEAAMELAAYLRDQTGVSRRVA